MTDTHELIAEAMDLVIRLEAFATALAPDDLDAEVLWAAARVLRRLNGLESEELCH